MRDDRRGPDIFGGLLIGAIGGALAVILMDPDKRERMRRTMNDWMSTGQRKLEEAKIQLEEKTNQGRKQLAKKLRGASDRLEENT